MGRDRPSGRALGRCGGRGGQLRPDRALKRSIQKPQRRRRKAPPFAFGAPRRPVRWTGLASRPISRRRPRVPHASWQGDGMTGQVFRQVVGVAAALLLWVGDVQAQDYPNRPIMIIVGVAPGGITDVTTRVYAEAVY